MCVKTCEIEKEFMGAAHSNRHALISMLEDYLPVKDLEQVGRDIKSNLRWYMKELSADLGAYVRGEIKKLLPEIINEMINSGKLEIKFQVIATKRE